MSDMLLDLTSLTGQWQPKAERPVTKYPERTGVHGQAFTHSDLIVAGIVASGHVGAMEDLLARSQIDDTGYNFMASRALLAWNETPLEYHTKVKMLAVLMIHGANGNIRTPKGDTVAERLGARLGTIEGNEARAIGCGRINETGPAGDILRECWALMEKAGTDMSEAMRVRNMAIEPGR